MAILTRIEAFLINLQRQVSKGIFRYHKGVKKKSLVVYKKFKKTWTQ